MKGYARNVALSELYTQDSVDESECERYNQLMEVIGWFFFDLLILGYVEDPVTGRSFRVPGGLQWAIYIEVSIYTVKRQLYIKRMIRKCFLNTEKYTLDTLSIARVSCIAARRMYNYASRLSRTRDTVKLTVCLSIPAVTAQRLQCYEN